MQKRRARILVVDDEPLMAPAIRRALADADVRSVAAAADAMALVRDGERFDVILCDIMMPEMDGGALYQEIARAAPDQAERVIFMSGAIDHPTADGLLSTVPNPCLPKPLRP